VGEPNIIKCTCGAETVFRVDARGVTTWTPENYFKDIID
jgi:hypothetical protein